jgi:predicted amidohydrolase
MIKVASYQFTPASFIQTRKAQIRNILEKTILHNIDFLCLPEGSLTGYYSQETLARENSLDVNGEDFQEWLTLFNNTTATVIVGFNERNNDQIFDSAAIIENGLLLGVQRKHHLYHNYFTSGTSFSTFRSKGITFGVVICLDTTSFEPSRLLALQGATILFSPMCNKVSTNHAYAKRPLYYSHFVARTFENRCWLISADWIWANDGTYVCPGHSVIYDPDGVEIVRSLEGEEGFIMTEISQEHLFTEKGRRIHGSPVLKKEINRITYTITENENEIFSRNGHTLLTKGNA